MLVSQDQKKNIYSHTQAPPRKANLAYHGHSFIPRKITQFTKEKTEMGAWCLWRIFYSGGLFLGDLGLFYGGERGLDSQNLI